MFVVILSGKRTISFEKTVVNKFHRSSVVIVVADLCPLLLVGGLATTHRSGCAASGEDNPLLFRGHKAVDDPVQPDQRVGHECYGAEDRDTAIRAG